MPDQPPSIIAIDGPAASGKSTLGRRLAESLGYLFFDTGVMYRAVTWQALERGIDVRDEAAVTALAKEMTIDVRPASAPDGRLCDVLANGIDITWESRSAAVDANVSIVAAYRGVRVAMGEQQRQILADRGKDVLLVGIGATVSSCLHAAGELAKRGVSATVVDARFAKPLDADLLLPLVRRIGRVITVEENVLAGGFGSAVLELLEESGEHPQQFRRLGIRDRFVEHGAPAELRAAYPKRWSTDRVSG